MIARTHDNGNATVWSTTDEATPGRIRKYREWRGLDKGHVGDIYFAKFFPSGKVVLSGGADTTLRVWDILDEDYDGTPVTMLKGHTQAVFEADFVDRGRNLVSCSRDGTTKLFDVPTQTVIASFSPSAGPILSTRVGSASTGSATAPAAAGDSREVGTDGNLIALAAENGTAYIYDLRSRSLVSKFLIPAPEGAPFSMNRVSFHPSGLLLTGDSLGRISAWDCRNPSAAASSFQRNTSPVTALISYGPNKFVAAQGDGSCFVWDLAQGSSTFQLCATDYDPLFAVAGSTAAQQVFVGGRDGVMRGFQL